MRLKPSYFDYSPSFEKMRHSMAGFFIITCLGVLFTTLSGMSLWLVLGAVPIFPIALVFYLSLFYPKQFSLLDVFLLGVLCDVTFGQGLGFYSALFILLRITLQSVKRYAFSHSYLMGWTGFIMFSFFSYLIELSLLNFHNIFYSPFQLLKGYGVLILVYPFLSFIMGLSMGLVRRS